MNAWLPRGALFGALLGLVLDSVPMAAEAPDEGPEPQFALPTRHDRIGRVVAPVRINGQGPFRFVVDTGASHTTISPQLVARLGLQAAPEQSILLNGVTGVESVPVVAIDRLQAGDLVIEHLEVPVVWSAVMAGADGILGVAGLRRERILVDFRKDRIVISRSRLRRDMAQYVRVYGHRVAGGLLAVDVRISGIKARAVIDTGAERTIGNLALQEELRRRRRLSDPRSTKVFGATTDVSEGLLQIAPPIVLGAATISHVPMVFGDFHIFKVWGLDERPTLLIGMDVLGTLSGLVIDFEREALYLRE